MMQIKLIFTTKVSHLASFWKWDFLELGNGVLLYLGFADKTGRQRMDVLALLAVVFHYAEKEVHGYQHIQSYTLVPHQRGQNAP